ncbi:unnamed protein product [Alternaria alternata]
MDGSNIAEHVDAAQEEIQTTPNERFECDDGVNTAQKRSARDMHGWKWATAYVSMLSTTLLFALDNTIVANIQPAIINDFGHLELLAWIGTGFALGTMFILLWGKVYSVFNIKWVYIFNIFWFEAGSALCGAASNIEALIIGRVIAGVGGSGMYSGTLTYVSVLCNSQEKPAYLAGSTVVWGIGSVLGPVVGGAFAMSSATWRWGFYINLPIGAIFAPVYLLLFPSIDPHPCKTLADKLRLIDWISAVIFLSGSTCLTITLTFGGVIYSFVSGTVVALWTVTGVLLITFIVILKLHPLVTKENRLYPLHFFKQPILINMQVQVFLSSGIVLAMTYYVPLYFQFVKGDDTVDENTSNANIYGYNILVGTGTGCYIVAGFAIVQFLVPAHDIANAISAMAIAQDLGMVCFLAISGSLFHNIAVEKVGKALPEVASAEIGNLIAGSSSKAFRRLSEAEKALVIPEIASAMSSVWTFFLAAAALSVICSVPLLKAKLGGEKTAATVAT